MKCSSGGKSIRKPGERSNEVRALVAAGDYKGALAIAKDFRLGMTANQKLAMSMAYECMVHPAFYKQLNYDTERSINVGIAVLKELYGKKEAV